MFKLGDIVRITGNTNHSQNRVGDIGVVSKIEAGRSSMLVWTDRTHGNPFCLTLPNEMELVVKKELKERVQNINVICVNQSLFTM